jgi:chaperone required for assembly of F1-ATPase
MRPPASIETTDIRASDGTYTVLVNGLPLRTPKGHPVTLRSWDLANAMADELMALGEVDLQRVTLYALHATQRDFIEGREEATIGVILQHLPGDFVLHPDADPALAAVQLAAWAPLLTFWRALGLEVPIANPLQAAQIPWELTEALQVQLTAMSPAQLSVVVQAVTHLGSATLGICLAHQTITVEEAVAALTATASQVRRDRGDEDPLHDAFVAEMRQTVRRLWQYTQLNA